MAASKSLTVLQLNDSHAYLEPHEELFWNGDHAEYRKTGGFARIATILKDVRAERAGRVLTFDGGDTIHGTHVAVQSKGEALIPILNALQFDAMTAHWEFAYGPEQFRKIAQQLSYPVLACNVYDQASQRRVFPAYTVCEAGGLRVGVIGIAATIVDKTMPPSFSEGLSFTLGNQELPGCIADLRSEEKADLIVVLSHLGFPQDVKIAQEVKGIDVLLSAHTHNRLVAPMLVADTIIIQSGSHGSFLGRLDLEVQGQRIIDFRHELLIIEQNIEPDLKVEALVSEALHPHRQELNQVIGSTSTGLNRNTMLESTMDNLLLQSLLDHTGAEIAFSNGWRYGAPVRPGPVTLNDLWNIIPVNPLIALVELTGDEIRTMLEENLEHTFSSDPYRQMGGYLKRTLGMNMYVKIENAAGSRIQELFVQGQQVKTDQIYTAAFVTAQGVPDKYGTNRTNLDVHAIEALRRYIVKDSPITANLRGAVLAV
ncbi:MAG TPA: 5'-nucleotidase C-terminal domain-containing protein [Anaerolineales bacterium]|nr:5'-nucleotidase C-terminal domain-containing protein [Anaerolineales bacterium]